MKPSPLRHLLPLIFLLAQPARARTWTASDGRTVEGDFVSTTTNSVTIRRVDGQTFTIPLEKLSAADRTWIATPSNTAKPGVQAGAAPAGSPIASPASTALTFETSDFARGTLYKSGPGFGLSMAPSGAFGMNATWESSHNGKWFIEYQRICMEAIGAGLALNDDAAVERGLKMIEWGLAHMEADGSFKCDDAYHSASFFIEAAAYSLLLLEASPAHEKWKPRIEALKPGLKKTAHWMANPAVSVPVWNGVQKQFAHRWFACAAALGETGVLLNDRELLAKAKTLLRGGIRAQLPNGVNPEKEGYDSIYQAAGLVYATHYYAIVADGADKTALKRTIDKGLAWLVSRISTDGVINVQGNTRTAGQEVGRSGNVKGAEPKFAVRSLGFWAVLASNPAYQDLAQKVSAASQE